jgi:hypothetical protein
MLNENKLKQRPANRRLAQWRVKWLIKHFTSHQLLWCIDSFVLRNPPPSPSPKTLAVILTKTTIKINVRKKINS